MTRANVRLGEMLHHRELARDLFESAELLFHDRRYRDAAPLLRRAVEEALIAAAMAVGREGPFSLGDALRAVEEEPSLMTLRRGMNPRPLIEQLARIADEALELPLALDPSTRAQFRRLFDQAAVFVHRAFSLVGVASRSEREIWWRRMLTRAAAVLCALVAVGMVVGLVVGWVRDFTTGLAGQYFADPALEEPAARRVARYIDFTWPPDSLPRGVSQERFSVRWTGRVEAPEAGTYHFTVRSDDGARLWVADRLLVDAWVLQAVTEHSGTVELEAGWHPIRLEYFQDGGAATCQLRWLPPGGFPNTIPASRLRPR